MILKSFCLLAMIMQSILSASTNHGVHLRVYDNIAEITKPICPADLPVIFSEDEWFDIRSDSIRLLGNCIKIHAQIIALNQTSLNGQKILIQRDLNNDTYTEGVMIDERRNLIQDLTDNTYYTLSNDRIRYFSLPFVRNYSINFDLQILAAEQLYIRYLQKNIKWKVRYDLLLAHNDTDAVLQAYADIRNDGNSALKIDLTELVSGDIDLRSTSSSENFPTGVDYGQQAGFNGGATGSAPTVSDSAELAGVYIYTVNETLHLNPQTNYILPMFRPTIDIERYGLIEKEFSSQDNHGHAQRGYRFRVEDAYLPSGQAFVRESDRIVGETYWSALAANETNEFALGEDPDLQYFEYVRFESRREIRNSNRYPFSSNYVSKYTINLYLMNNKDRDINFEYRLKFYSQERLDLIENTSEEFLEIDGSSIVGIFQLNANTEQEYQFTFEI